MKLNRSFALGLLVGALLAAGFVFVVRISRHAKGNLAAQIQGEALTQQELHKRVAPYLVPIENDRYAVLNAGVKGWLQNRLIEKEAKAQGVSVEELYQKEIWSKVQVSYQAIQEYYNQNKELYPQPLAQIAPLLSKQVRYAEYSKVKEKYVAVLSQKYNAKIHIKKPASFVEGLALPSAILPEAQPAPSPIPGKQAVEIKSQPGHAPSRGPENAPVTLTEFADFHCHFCKQVTPTLDEVFKNYTGKVRWVFRNYPLSKTPGQGSFRTHEAAACAQEQGKFWEYHDALFSLPSAPQEADLDSTANKIGLDTPKFQECLKSGRYQNAIQEDIKEGERRGVQGTPTIYVNDQVIGGAYPYEHFVKVVESALTPGGAPVAPAAPSPPSPPPTAQFDDLEGRPTRGPKGAPVTLVEFSDFYCPFCKRVEPTLEMLEKNYPGKIRRVWRHYPLSFHTGSDRAHQAAECANEQGKFWAYHKKLFEKQGTPLDDPALNHLAKEADLDKKKFKKCLESGKYKDLVQKEIARGNTAGVRGTPAVFVNGKLVSGAQPYENFDQIVKSELAKS